jgi:hypothetical protein
MRRPVMLSVLPIALLAGCASSRSSGIPDPGVETRTETVRVGGVGAQHGTTMTTVSSVSPGVTTIFSPIDDVWRVLPAIYDSLGIPVDRLDHAKHIIGNTGFKLRRRLGDIPLTRYLDCGQAQGGPSAETYEVNLSVLTELQPAARGTAAATIVQATARPVTFVGEHTPCKSTGGLEKSIARLLGDLL